MLQQCEFSEKEPKYVDSPFISKDNSLAGAEVNTSPNENGFRDNHISTQENMKFLSRYECGPGVSCLVLEYLILFYPL